MQLKCLFSIYAFVLFWGIIALFVFPSLLIYFFVYPWMRYPQDIFQYISSMIFRIFFKFLYVVDLEIRKEGELIDGAIYVATHQSSLDYPILGTFIHRYLTIANVNFTTLPFFSYVSKLIGIRTINKNHNLGDMSLIYNELEDMLKKNRNVIIFPEGTRGDGKKLKQFKRGAFKLSMQTGRPIVPIIIDGSARILAKGTLCFKTIKRTKVSIILLPPLYPQDFSDENEIMQNVSSKMEYDKYRN